MISTIYLSNGSRLVLHEPWHQKVDEHGHIHLYTITDQTYFGTITSAGILHISNERKFATYYQPGEPIPAMPVVAEVVIVPVAAEEVPDPGKKSATKRKRNAV